MATAKKMLASFSRKYIKEQYEELKTAMQANNVEKANENYAAIQKGYHHLKSAKNMNNYMLDDKSFVAEIEEEIDKLMIEIEKEFKAFLNG